MLFLHPWLLAALAGVLIPVIIHLVRRHAARPVDWGAMRFLLDTLSERRRRIEWEDLLLMAARCLLLALAALAVARPFVPPNSKVPWAFVLPLLLLAVVAFGGSFVAGRRVTRGVVRALAVVLLLAAAALVAVEQAGHLRRFETSGRRDVALVIDASSSMGRAAPGGATLFQQALDEARRIVGEAPRGTSFVVVLGGPAPRALSQTPLAHRADVLAQLNDLRPVGGPFRAHEALGVATVTLAEGLHAAKQLIVLTDGQRHGWRFDDAGAWRPLEEAWASLPQKPRLLLRRLPAPAALKNAGIAAISTPRSLIGTDRPALVRVTVENTGTVAVAPGAVTLEVDGAAAGRAPLGLLEPGQVEKVEFRHRFAAAGPRVATARLEVRDELAEDDRADRVVVVRERLPVLFVDGNPSGRFLERAAGHAALALAPAAELLRGDAAEGFLMDPRVVAAADLDEKDIDAAEVIVLADVPRLPAALAERIAAHVARGGGLLVVAGPRCDAGFFNAWSGPAGPLLPLELGPATTSPDGVSPAPATFQHESLALFGDQSASDLHQALVHAWRRTSEHPDRGVVGAAFSNGDPLLAGRTYGSGRCLLVTCPLDGRSGNLPARTAFVPLVHELTTWTAGGGPILNVAASWSPSVSLGRHGGGLAAQYSHRDDNRRSPVLERLDPAVDWHWADGSPDRRLRPDQFAVRWTGRLVPPLDGEYLLEAEVDDRVELRIDGRTVLATSMHEPRPAKVTLAAGRPLPVEVLFEEDNGEAFVSLLWTPPGGPRAVIPASAWLPPEQENRQPLSATDPLGATRHAYLSIGRRGRELRIDGDAVPGLYHVDLTDAARDALPLPATAGRLPVVVERDIRESRPDPLQPADLAHLRSRLDTLEPATADEVLAVLTGRGFGREITRTVALAALALLVLETALARWVSRSRRAAEAEPIHFGDATTVPLGKGAPR